MILLKETASVMAAAAIIFLGTMTVAEPAIAQADSEGGQCFTLYEHVDYNLEHLGAIYSGCTGTGEGAVGTCFNIPGYMNKNASSAEHKNSALHYYYDPGCQNPILLTGPGAEPNLHVLGAGDKVSSVYICNGRTC